MLGEAGKDSRGRFAKLGGAFDFSVPVVRGMLVTRKERPWRKSLFLLQQCTVPCQFRPRILRSAKDSIHSVRGPTKRVSTVLDTGEESKKRPRNERFPSARELLDGV